MNASQGSDGPGENVNDQDLQRAEDAVQLTRGDDGLSAMDNDAPARDTAAAILEQTLDDGHICRPQLFTHQAVAGLTTPCSVATIEGPQGRWLVCLQWTNGRREIRQLTDSIELSDGEQIWFDPKPPPPDLRDRSAWSKRAQKRWLNGATPDPAELFSGLCETIGRFVAFPGTDREGCIATLALWVMLSYCFPAWRAVPYLWIHGAKGSGKTTLLEVLANLAWRPTLQGSMTAAALVRTVHFQGGTVLLDEAEQLNVASGSELATALRVGYKAGGSVRRAISNGTEFRSFDVFSPKALASIRPIEPAFASRCIRLGMLPVHNDAPQLQAHLNADLSPWQTHQDDLHGWALSAATEIRRIAHERSDALRDLSGRDSDLWRPLLDLAGLCERAGVNGLVGRVRCFADAVISDRQQESRPDPDELLLRTLTACVAAGQADITPKELLGFARSENADSFDGWNHYHVAHALRRYGICTCTTSNGRRSYRRVTLDQLHRVARNHGFNFPLGNATNAT